MLRRLLLFVLVALLMMAASDEGYSHPNYGDKVAVLIYHHVDNHDTSSVTITTNLLDRQLRYLSKRGYHFITMEDFRRYMEGGPVERNAVLMTFDDGYASFYNNVLPVMSKYGVQPVDFVITESVDHPEKSNVPAMSPEQLADIGSKGNAELQCHSDQLHRLLNPKESYLSGRLDQAGVKETDSQYKDRILNDTKECIRQLRRFHSKADAYAYPYGMYNKDVPGILNEAGIRYAFTVKPGALTRKTNPMEIPRINAGSPFMSPKRVHKQIVRKLQ